MYMRPAIMKRTSQINAYPRTEKLTDQLSTAVTGHLNSIQSDVHPRLENSGIKMPHSTEYCFVANPDDLRGKFSERGDSGSFIFTRHGQWAGVQWGGKTVSNGEMTPISYVTDGPAVLDYLGNIETEEGWFEARLSGS